MELIKDRKQFEKFIKILPDLERDEVYFLSLSARNKYLTKEEREFYSLGRTEMFSREIARDKKGIELALKRMENSLLYKTTNTGKLLPEKALVVYININPSSMIRAGYAFAKEIHKETYEAFNAEVSGNEYNFDAFLRLPSRLMNHIQKSRSRKVFIDIDVDLNNIKDINIIEDLIDEELCGTTFFRSIRTIYTKGGIHILIKKDEIEKDFNLGKFVSNVNKQLQVKEANFNKNQMIPLPGTEQAGTLVTFN